MRVVGRWAECWLPHGRKEKLAALKAQACSSAITTAIAWRVAGWLAASLPPSPRSPLPPFNTVWRQRRQSTRLNTIHQQRDCNSAYRGKWRWRAGLNRVWNVICLLLIRTSNTAQSSTHRLQTAMLHDGQCVLVTLAKRLLPLGNTSVEQYPTPYSRWWLPPPPGPAFKSIIKAWQGVSSQIKAYRQFLTFF